MDIFYLIILAVVLLFVLKTAVDYKHGESNILYNINNNKFVKGMLDNINNKKQQLVKKYGSTVYNDPYYNFPDPMSSTITIPLSKGIGPLNVENTNVVGNNPDVEIIRDSGLEFNNKRNKFNPDNLKKDTVDPDPGKYLNLGLAFGSASETVIEASNDVYLSKYANFASSNITNELTNTGYLYDDSGQYINIKNKTLPENCKFNDETGLSCNFNGRLQQIPKSLMGDNKEVLNSIGTIKYDGDFIKSVKGYKVGDVDGYDYKIWNYDNEKPFNGGGLFKNKYGNEVYGSNPLGYNETYMEVSDNNICQNNACTI